MQYNKNIVNGHWFEVFALMNDNNELPIKFSKEELDAEILIIYQCKSHRDYYNVNRIGSFVALNRRMRHNIFNKWKEAYGIGNNNFIAQCKKNGNIDDLNRSIDRIYKIQEISEVSLGL